MKIALSATGKDLGSTIDPRFGRCANIIILETDSGEFEVHENPNAMAGGGAGIQTSQFIADSGAKAVITGNVGPNAFRTLAAAGITVYTGISGTIQDAVDKYKSGDLKATESPTKKGHW